MTPVEEKNYDVISGDGCAIEVTLYGTIGGWSVPIGRILRTDRIKLQATDLIRAVLKQ
jgi:hypothetical protein